jgi:hypothetical protein
MPMTGEERRAYKIAYTREREKFLLAVDTLHQHGDSVPDLPEEE